MRRILKDKRGMALESAILFMLVVATLATLLAGAVMISHLRVRLNGKNVENEILIEEIGEKFRYIQSQDGLGDLGEYTSEVEFTDFENKTLTLKKGETVVLYIKIENDRVIKWQYSKPN